MKRRARTNIQPMRMAKELSGCKFAVLVDKYMGRATMTQSWLSRIENGQIEPRLSTAFAIAQALGVTIEEAFGLRPDKATLIPLTNSPARANDRRLSDERRAGVPLAPRKVAA